LGTFAGSSALHLDATPKRQRFFNSLESNQIGIFKTSNLVEGRDKYGHVFQFEYDQQNRMIAKTDRRGHTFHFEYDENGRCVHSYGDRGLLEVRLRYLPQVTFVTKADGGQWAYRYNDAGVITEIVDPYGGVQKFNLDPEGRLAKEVDPNGNVTRYIYNGIGALIGKEDPLGNFSPIPEDPEFPEPDDHEVADCPIEWEYGRLLAFEDVSSPPDPYKTIWHQLIKYINGSIKPPIKPISAGPFYDETGCLLREVDSEGYAEEWTYDANGNTNS
jgi:YD repeat-containing protein